MVRHLSLVLLAACGAQMAQAENSIKLTDRTDLRMMVPDADANKQTGTQFDVQYLRLDFKGKINDMLGYRLRMRLDKTAAKDNLKGVSDFANYAYVEPKINDMLTFRIGKQWTYQGGWENDLSSSDTYLGSGFLNKTINEAVGVNAMVKIEGQNLYFLLTNSDKVTYADGSTPRFLNYGFAYQGMIADLIQPMVAVTMRPTTEMGKGNLLAAVGVKVDPKPVGGELDLEYWTDNAPDKAPALMTVSAAARAKMGVFGPQLKLFYDMNTIDGDDNGTAVGFAPAIEFYPYEGSDFRFHIAYTGTSTSPKVGSSTYTQAIYLGVKGTWSML